jgi:hypothetical protein
VEAVDTWPSDIAGLSPRAVIAYEGCADCVGDPPADVVARLGGGSFIVAGAKGIARRLHSPLRLRVSVKVVAA